MWYHLHAKPKKTVQMNLISRQKESHRHSKQTYTYQKGEGWRDKLGIWDYRYTTLYKID